VSAQTTTAIFLTIEITTTKKERREKIQPTRAFHPVCFLASNLSLNQSYLKIAMAGKGGKSGKGNGPGKRGIRVENRGVGKKGLVGAEGGVVEVKGTMIGEGRALIGGVEEGWEVLEGFKQDGDFWTNGTVKVKCGKKGLEESGWKVWEDETMVDTFDGKVVKKEKLEEVFREEELMEVDMEEANESEEEEKEEERGKKGKGVRAEVVEISSGSEEDRGVGLIEEWKEERRAKEKRLKVENKKREIEGVVNRGKDRGMSRVEVLEMKQSFGDYEELVSDVEYVLGIEKGLARCFVIDREIRKVVDMMVSGGGKVKRETGKRGEREEEREERVEVRSEVVVEKGLREKEDLKREVGVKGGRTYGEVLMGVGSGVVEGEEVTKKMEEERMSWVESGIEREKRSGRVVEVVMDSQEEGSEGNWKREEVIKELGVAEGAVEKVVMKGNRMKVVLKENEVAETVERVIKEKGKDILGGGVVEVRRNENWVGIVIPGMSVERWEGKLEEMREMIEVENDGKLMRMPRWLANEDRRKALNLKSVGVIAHVAKESLRVKFVEEGMNWDGRKIQVKRYVEEKQLMFCTKCAMVGHNWWQCERKKLRCNICAVDGHAGWMHRCERCKVQRKSCIHYRKCVMCGKDHKVAEAREGNCLGVRA